MILKLFKFSGEIDALLFVVLTVLLGLILFVFVFNAL